MSHVIREKTRLLARIRRIKGQIEGVERALEGEAACGEVMRQLASVRGAVTGLTREVVEDHLRAHVLGAPSEADREKGVEEILEILGTYMK